MNALRFRSPGWRTILVGGAALAAVAVATVSNGQITDQPAPVPLTTNAQPNVTLTPQAPADNAPAAERGKYLVTVGDCAACHTRPGGPDFAGGLPLNTPFGVIYTANITPDKDTGIGSWTPEQFRRAMQEGKDDQGKNLYPAFPYPYYTHVSAADVEAIRAYLATVKPVSYSPPANKLPFPLNIRVFVKAWNWLNFKPGRFEPVATQTAEWNRGAYIVNGLGHCGACHTPKTFIGGDKKGQALQGGELDYWYAPSLNGDGRGGLKNWSVGDITTYLRSGSNDHADASGSMQDVVEISTSKMSDADLRAIAVYLKSLPASPNGERAPAAPAKLAMHQGQSIYVDQCASCHAVDGTGSPGLFPPLRGNSDLQSARATTPLHVILAGADTASTADKPTGPAMPAFAWKLTDAEIAAVTTYVRNSWGNAAEPVSAGDVSGLRRHVAAHPVNRPKAKV